MKITEILKEHFKNNMTEDVEKKIEDAFELMVSEKVVEKKEEIKTQLQEEADKSIEEYKAELEERLNDYIEQVNKEFIDEHLKEEEISAKVELAEKLVEGILTTVKENNMNIALEDKDIIAQSEKEIKRLEESLNEAMEKIEESRKQDFEKDKAISILKLTEDLADTQKEKVINMMENVSAKDIDEFEEKVKSSIELGIETKETKKEDEDSLEEKFDEKKEELDDLLPKWHKAYRK